MYKKIIVSLALDQGFGPTALELARKLKDEGGEIIALHVFEQLHGSVRAYVPDEVVRQALDKVRAGLAERIGDADDVTPVIIKGHSGRDVTDYAAKEGADLIIVGSHKPGIGDYLLGSTSARIVRHAPCAVHVLR
ncbi:universal stress protein [Nioella sediminis]|uniref:universal stress protein n=1 Tax=Nioella sediminis TaxID=1912092 RepID=UPI0008FD551B|nr:universal stress protein [Nioella sediminis]TBX29450.1 universal stress protein [Roseovarius sp. JS7-11]